VTAKQVGLSKSRIIAHQQCPRRLWLEVNRRDLLPPVDPATQARFDAGHEVGRIAQELHRDGILIDVDNLSQAIKDTANALKGDPRPIFEATFSADNVLVSADLLLPDGNGYRLVEVKSSTSVKDYHREDASIQGWVLAQNGMKLSSIEIAHVDTDFCYHGDGDYNGLLKYEDITIEAQANYSDVPVWIAAAKATLAGTMPLVEPGECCQKPFACPFRDYCTPPHAEGGFPLGILPNGGKVVAGLEAKGFHDLREVPEGELTNAKHERVRKACVTGVEYLDPEAAKIILALPYPRYYLDFESIQFVVPLWADTHPYDQIPFQWSCHIETAPGKFDHDQFLTQYATDPRRAFTESLIRVLGSEGPIIVFNAAFERTRMKEMGELFPDLAPAMNSAIDRLFDLLPVARSHYYHPEMRGSWSIKAILKSIAPELDYKELMVGDGNLAMDAFRKLISPTTSALDREETRNALLEYCKRDTYAMVVVANHLAGAKYIQSGTGPT
jgi:hypothetical protein